MAKLCLQSYPLDPIETCFLSLERREPVQAGEFLGKARTLMLQRSQRPDLSLAAER